MPKVFSNGNIAIVNGAIYWGLESNGSAPLSSERLLFAAGYPITPVNEVTEYFGVIAEKMGVGFIQAESEIAAGNMLIGASSVNTPAITVTSSPGISLMQEAISYAAAMELGGKGLVYADVVRGGPGLGNIQGAQSDFNQAVFGGGHGDYQNIVLAPASSQEMFDFTRLAFRLSYQYKIPGFILSDGYVGQLKESYEIPDTVLPLQMTIENDIRTSIYVREGILEEHNWKLYRRFEALKKDPLLKAIEVAPYRLEDAAGKAKIVIVSYGFFSRIASGIADRARKMGIPIGHVSLKSLNPFPEEALRKIVDQYGPLYVMEGGINQLGRRIQTAIGKVPIIGTCQRPGGTLPGELEILKDIEFLHEKIKSPDFQKRFLEYNKGAKAHLLMRENLGDRFESIALNDSTHRKEYEAGMVGKKPETRPSQSMTDKNSYFCSGCDHRNTIEILGKTFDRLNDRTFALYSPVGCSIFMYDFFKNERIQNIQVPHGRGPAAASATKKCKPNTLVICYQGDGDALDIGLGELLHASARAENITLLLINNGTYGMTGGQLSSATPLGEVSKTTPKGRDASKNGYPIDLSQMLHRLGVSYFRRTLVGSPEWNQRFEHYLLQALLHQIKCQGMSVIEVLASCAEHQKASKKIIESFTTSGKKPHAIALSREYTNTVMTKTFSLEAGWGEDFDNVEEILAGAAKKKLGEPIPAEKRYAEFIKMLDSFGFLLDKQQIRPSLNEQIRIYLCGEGGQGVQLVSDILIKTGVTSYAFSSPWYEPEVTKARTAAAVTLSANAHVNPMPEPGEVDVLVCMTAQSFIEKKHYVKNGGLVIVDTQGKDVDTKDSHFKLVKAQASSITLDKLKDKRCANIFLLGVLVEKLGIFNNEIVEKTIKRTVLKSTETNLQAYQLGRAHKEIETILTASVKSI